MLDCNTRLLYTMILSSRTAILPREHGPPMVIPPAEMGAFLENNVLGFKRRWVKFILDPATRVHTLLEQADDANNVELVNLLMAGKRAENDTIDKKMSEFLKFHVATSVVTWNNV